MVIINLVFALAIVLAIVLVIRFYLKNTNVQMSDTEDLISVETKPTIDDLVLLVARTIGSFLEQDFTNQNLSEMEYKNKLAAKKRLRLAREEGSYGDLEYSIQ